MTKALDAPDFLTDIENLRQRIYNLEQRRTLMVDPATGGNVFPGGIVVGPDEIFVNSPVPVPTNVVLAWGSFFDVIFINVSWNAPVGAGADQVVLYEVELTKVGQGVSRFTQTAGTSVRFEPVEPNTQYSVRVRSINRLGASSAFTAAVNVTTGEDASAPGQVTGLVATTGLRTVLVRWTENTEVDMVDGHGLYEVQIATNSGFTTGLRTIRVNAIVAQFADLTSVTAYWLRVRAIDSSGNAGAYSSSVNVTTPQAVAADFTDRTISSVKIALDAITNDLIAANAVTVTEIADNAVTTPKLIANAVTAAKIAADTITANEIAAGAITASEIAAGAVIAGKIAANAVTAGTVNADVITGREISAGSIAAVDAVFAAAAINSADINTLVAGKITSDTISTAILTIASSGLIRRGRSSAPFHYIIDDAAGTRLYRSGSSQFVGGTLYYDLNINTGTLTIGNASDPTQVSIIGTITGSTITGGVIRTASSGGRVEMGTGAFSLAATSYFTGDATETLSRAGYVLSAVSGAGGTRRGFMEIQGPVVGNPPPGNAFCLIDIFSRSQDGTVLGSVDIWTGSDAGLVNNRFEGGNFFKFGSGGYLYLIGPAFKKVAFAHDQVSATGTTTSADSLNYLNVAVTFSSALPSSPYMAQSGVWTGGSDCCSAMSYSRSTTGCTIRMFHTSPSSASRTLVCEYIAIGRA